MKVTLADGSSYQGTTPREILNQLQAADWTNYNTTDEYSKNMARRISIFFDEQISYRTNEEFLQELERIGFIVKIERDK